MEILNLNIHSKDIDASYEQLCNKNISLSAVCTLHFVIKFHISDHVQILFSLPLSGYSKLWKSRHGVEFLRKRPKKIMYSMTV